MLIIRLLAKSPGLGHTIFFSKKILYWICYNIAFFFMFWFFDHEACGILAPWPRIEPSPPALEDEALTTGPPPKSLGHTILMAWTCSVPLCLVKQWLYSFLLHSEFCLWDLIRCWCTEAEFLASHFFFLTQGNRAHPQTDLGKAIWRQRHLRFVRYT